MEENQVQETVEESLSENSQPVLQEEAGRMGTTIDIVPISNNLKPVSQQEGQVHKAPSELILGKFKSVDDLSKAYEQLEKKQGMQSTELGKLRSQDSKLKEIQGIWDKHQALVDSRSELEELTQKYDAPEYFQDPSFRQLYSEAFKVLGKDLDTEAFVGLLENYVTSRMYLAEKQKSANAETQNAIESMTFTPNKNSTLTPPKKRLDEMTSKEVDELLDRLI